MIMSNCAPLTCGIPVVSTTVLLTFRMIMSNLAR